jgi:hypothetical protein
MFILESFLFADDTPLYESDDNIDTLITKVNSEFIKLTQYFHSSRLSLHTDKTKLILFTNNRAIQNMDVKLCINNNSLTHLLNILN